MYVVCEEHLEEGIDAFVDVYEAPPDLYRLDAVEFGDWIQPHHCDFCSRIPKYLVV